MCFNESFFIFFTSIKPTISYCIFSSFILRVVILLNRGMVWTHEVLPGTTWVQTIPSFSKIHHEQLLNGEMNFFLMFEKLVVRKYETKWGNEYLFRVTGVKKMKWFLSLTRCHFQPRVTFQGRGKNHWIVLTNQWRWLMSFSSLAKFHTSSENRTKIKKTLYPLDKKNILFCDNLLHIFGIKNERCDNQNRYHSYIHRNWVPVKDKWFHASLNHLRPQRHRKKPKHGHLVHPLAQKTILEPKFLRENWFHY